MTLDGKDPSSNNDSNQYFYFQCVDQVLSPFANIITGDIKSVIHSLVYWILEEVKCENVTRLITSPKFNVSKLITISIDPYLFPVFLWSQ